MMNEKVKKNWLKALRSGDYKQGTNHLCMIKDGIIRYCCLGVLCEAEGIPYKIVKFSSDTLYWESFKEYDEMSTNLTSHFITKIKLSRHEETKLTTMNDIDDREFSFIADWIERNL